MKLLLADPRIDPSVENNEVFEQVCERGHADIVKLLLEDSRVDPLVNIDRGVMDASRNGHADVVKVLLADPRIYPSFNIHWPLEDASRNGHAAVVKLLLADPRVDASANDSLALILASLKGYASVVKLLLAEQRVDPSADNNEALRRANEKGQTDVVKLLLADPRVARQQLIISDCTGNKRALDQLVAEQPQVIIRLFQGQIECTENGPLVKELLRWEARSTWTLLLSVKRNFGLTVAARVNDVLRELCYEWTRFDTVEVPRTEAWIVEKRSFLPAFLWRY
jgi:hypothetical protein